MAPSTQAVMVNHQLPDWETPNSSNRKALPRTLRSSKFKSTRHHVAFTLSQKLGRILPPRHKYCGFSRRTLMIIIGIAFVTILAVAIGLGLGLRKRNRDQDLPLPSNSENFTGDLTYYSPALGACGIVSSDNDNICAVSHIIFDAASTGSDPNANPLCGLKIRARRFNEQVNAQRSVDLTVVDRCTACKPKDIDLSPGAYGKLADPDRGRVDVTWAWLSPTAKI